MEKDGRFIGWPWKNMARILQHLDFYQVLQGNVVFFSSDFARKHSNSY